MIRYAVYNEIEPITIINRGEMMYPAARLRMGRTRIVPPIIPLAKPKTVIALLTYLPIIPSQKYTNADK
jgi:hypothetical protein